MLSTRNASTPRVETLNGTAVEPASVPMFTKYWLPVPPVDAVFSPILNAVVLPASCQFQAWALAPLLIVLALVAAVSDDSATDPAASAFQLVPSSR